MTKLPKGTYKAVKKYLDSNFHEKYGMKLIRTHTEAEGYGDCDFWYLNEGSEEV